MPKNSNRNELLKSNWSYFQENIHELALMILSYLSFVDLLKMMKVSSKTRTLALDNSLWRTHYFEWWSIVFLPPTSKETISKQHQHQNYFTAFKRIYLYCRPIDRAIITTTLINNNEKFQLFKSSAEPCHSVYRRAYPAKRKQLLIMATINGDIATLRDLDLEMVEIIELALVRRCRRCENQQEILDYFYSILTSLHFYQYNNHWKCIAKTTEAHYAAMLNQPRRLQHCLQLNPEFATLPNAYGITPYEFAKQYNHSACLEILEPFKSNKTVAIDAEKLNSAVYRKHLEFVWILLALGVSPAKEKLTPLIGAVHSKRIELIYLLLAHGSIPDATDKFHDTSIHAAATSGYAEGYKLLLDFDANPAVKNQNDHTPLIKATQGNHINIVFQLLMQNLSLNEKNIYGETALIIAAYKGFTTLLVAFLSYGAEADAEDNCGNTPLIGAARRGHISCLSILLKKNVDPNKMNKFGYCALMRAAQNGYINCMNLLLSTGANPFLITEDGFTALELALHNKQLECACLLGIAMTFFKKSIAITDSRIIKLKEARSYSPNYFTKLIDDIEQGRNFITWITRGMLKHLKIVNHSTSNENSQFNKQFGAI